MPIYCPLSEAVGIEPGEKSVLDFEEPGYMPYDQFLGLFGGETGSRFATERNHRLVQERRHSSFQRKTCPCCGRPFAISGFTNHYQRCLQIKNNS